MKQNTRTIVLTALLAALTTVATMVIRIPTPTLGYIHLGDGMVLLCGVLLGPVLGGFAAGTGSMLADLFAGYAAWVPGTFLIKALSAMTMGFIIRKNSVLKVAAAGIPAESVMVAGYFLYELLMKVVCGSTLTAAAAASFAGVPFNIVQGIAGIAVAAVLLPIIEKARKNLNA